jgi:hypothetical protein
MTERNKFFIHVGYPKTATTTLQKRLFVRHPDICYLGKPFDPELLAIEKQLLTLDEGRFDQRLHELRERFLACVPDCGKRTTLLLSHEGFLRPTRYQGHDLHRTAERIMRVIGEPLASDYEVNVLITVRNQLDIIPSYFFHFESRSPERFRQFIRTSLENPRQGYFASLFYDEVARDYTELFGNGHVRIMLFEEFVAERESFLRSLSGYLGIDDSSSLGIIGDGSMKKKARAGSAYRITANEYLLGCLQKYRPQTEQLPWLLRVMLKRIPLESDAFRISASDRRRIEALYATSNRRLAEDFGLDLECYGYVTGQSLAGQAG